MSEQSKSDNDVVGDASTSSAGPSAEIPNQAGASPQQPAEPDSSTTASAPEPAGASASAAPTEPSNPAPLGEFDDDWDEADSILTWKVLVGLVVALVVIGLGAFVLFGGKKKGDAGTTGESAADVETIRDNFDRPDNPNSLGKTPSGEDWQAALGTWGVKDKQAYVSQKNPNGPRNVAFVDIGKSDGSVGAKIAELSDSWGLVFRYRGPNAYWMIRSTKISFNIVRVANGDEAASYACLTKPAQDSNVRVEFAGQNITLFVDDKAKCTVSDRTLQDQTKVGFFVQGDGVGSARWSDFVAKKSIPTPAVTAAKASSVGTGTSGSSTTTKPGAGTKGQAGTTEAPKNKTTTPGSAAASRAAGGGG